MSTAYVGQALALLTQHGKEQVIAPALDAALGCRVQRVGGYDTDLLGSFTRETPRPGSQLDAARRKARIGMALSGLPVGLGSEGSFGPDPSTGLLPWNTELLVLIDQRLGIEVVGMAQGPGGGAHVQTGDWERLTAFAHQVGFPDHRLVLRPAHQDDPRLHKGIADWPQLRACFDACRALADDAEVFAELDLRAFANPSRMRRIGEAAQDLARRLASVCPACERPGYQVVQREAGLCCADCGLPTRQHLSELWQCAACQHQARVPRADLSLADPRHCDVCNP